ncbi:heme-degrading domain-containing protein [Labrys sp. KNU-23]|uniref:heme-degrading domain-containing protein n=1 Tax=Labrys sp. KNU-23 TaxID=2789216 RepID=UPI0011EC43AA|nr:heme-degrading domain-containing protein [Labrys sp. KNU-23]QEN88011.1 heme-degrading domain-containing protein [Labrys sp. KNU-23]
MPDEITLSELLRQEAVLTFPAFDNEIAIDLGTLALGIARERALPVAINVTRNRQQLFHAALAGTSLDNDQWIARKSAVVYRFGHSSFYMGQSTLPGGPTFHDRFMVDPKEYAAHGGSFPIIVEGTGLVGAITISGLPQQADHELVVEIITRFLEQRFGKKAL